MMQFGSTVSQHCNCLGLCVGTETHLGMACNGRVTPSMTTTSKTLSVQFVWSADVTDAKLVWGGGGRGGKVRGRKALQLLFFILWRVLMRPTSSLPY